MKRLIRASILLSLAGCSQDADTEPVSDASFGLDAVVPVPDAAPPDAMAPCDGGVVATSRFVLESVANTDLRNLQVNQPANAWPLAADRLQVQIHGYHGDRSLTFDVRGDFAGVDIAPNETGGVFVKLFTGEDPSTDAALEISDDRGTVAVGGVGTPGRIGAALGRNDIGLVSGECDAAQVDFLVTRHAAGVLPFCEDTLPRRPLSVCLGAAMLPEMYPPPDIALEGATVAEVGQGPLPESCRQGWAPRNSLGDESTDGWWVRLTDTSGEDWTFGIAGDNPPPGLAAEDVVSLSWRWLPGEFGPDLANVELTEAGALVAWYGLAGGVADLTPPAGLGLSAGAGTCRRASECTASSSHALAVEAGGESGEIAYGDLGAIGGYTIVNGGVVQWEPDFPFGCPDAWSGGAAVLVVP